MNVPKSYNLQNKLDMKRFAKDLEGKVLDLAKEQAMKMNHDATCPHCSKTISVSAGLNICPHCQGNVTVELTVN